MLRLVGYLLLVALTAAGLAWLADRPGDLQIVWQGYHAETSVFRAVVLLAAIVALLIFAFSIGRALWNSPAMLGDRMVRRRQKKGLDAVSGGLIAIGAGDAALASRYATQARRSLPHEPLPHLLRAQSAELGGDRATARRIYEAMLMSPETEQLGLRGLFLEAEREGAGEAARQFAARALKSNPKLGWSADALFSLQCRQKDWAGALETLEHVKKHGQIGKAQLERRRAVLLTAKALELEEDAADKSLNLALEAHALAPELVPAAALAGRILASRGNTGKAAKVLQRTWAKAPHPDLAAAYAYARIGDSTKDRLDRVRQLAALNPHSIESPIAIATTAVEARMYDEARRALEPLLAERLTQRVATLMARVEAGDNGAKGRVREWLARAMNAARDPAWIADGVTSDHWEPTSPVDGRLDAFQWRVPVESRDASRSEILARRLEELIAIEAPETVATVTQTVAESVIEKEAAAPAQPAPAPEAPEVVEAEPVTVTAKPSNGFDRGNARHTPEPPPPAEAERSQPAARTLRDNDDQRARRARKTAEVEIVEPRRPPDDPGPGPADPEPEQPIARRSFRAAN